MKEIWKPILENEYYEVSNKGNVRSWKIKNGNNVGQRSKDPSILKQYNHQSGYNLIKLRMNGDFRHFRVHRLVAMEFVPNPKNKKYVNHKNGVKHDNNASNLEWVTASENIRHAIDNGLYKPSLHFKTGENHKDAKLTRNDVLDIRNAYKLGCFTQKEIGDAYGISQSTTGRIINKVYWSHV